MIPDHLVMELERRFGPVHHVDVKPFSTHYHDANATVLVKVYRHIEPAARMVREIEALGSARQLDVRVPWLVGHGTYGNVAWTAVTIVPGEPLPLCTAADVQTFADTARRVLEPLHTTRLTCGPGPGWSAPDAPRVSTHLAAQLRAQIRALPACSLASRFSMRCQLSICTAT
jgi:hypothetical protein